MVYITPFKVRFLSYNIFGDCRERKEFFRYEAAMSMQKKEGCDMHSLPKEDGASCGMENRSFRRDSHFGLRKGKVKNWQNGGKFAKEGPKWREIHQHLFSLCDIILM